PDFENFLRVAVYLELFALEAGHKRAEIQVSYLRRPALRLFGEMEFGDLAAPATIVIPAFPLKLEKAGPLTVTVTCEGKKKNVLTKQISASETLAPFAIEPALPASQSRPDVSPSSSPPAPSRP